MRLHEWQQQFQRVVLGGARIDTLPLRETALTRECRMDIYTNAYRERLHEALRSNFPVLHQILGDDDFAAMGYAFIALYPPQTASIRWFGAELTNYLRAAEPYANCPALSELAQFEWVLRHTVDAGDADCISTHFLQAMQAQQWQRLICDLHPSLTILDFAWNVPQVWRAAAAGEEPPTPAPLASHWLVYRGRDLTSEWRSATAEEAAALRLWSRGENFAAVCDFLAEASGDAESAVTAAAMFMRTWSEQGLLVFSRAQH